MKYKYGALKKKILIQVAIIAAIGVGVVLVLQFFLSDRGMPYIMWAGGTSPETLELSEAQIMALGDIIQQGQVGFVVTVGLLALLVVIFYVSLMRMTKYFRETSGGVDKLLSDPGEKIILSPELDFMAEKLNGVKDTLEKRARDAREAEQRKDDLVVYLAHDIRTPLTTAIGYLNLLSEAPDMPAGERAKYVGITLDSALRLEELVDEFFEITRFNVQDIRLNPGEINLTHMLRQMADEFYPILVPHGKEIIIKADDKLTLCGDADKLARVFRNILKNAATFSDDHSAIRIRAGSDGENVTITFSNTGSPLPETELEAIFDKFYRLGESRPSNTGGAGLGLAIAKEIVTAHGGSICAASDGRETVFTVILPVAACGK